MGKKAKSLKGTYTYTVQQDGPTLKAGETIEIRRMDEKERLQFIQRDVLILHGQLNGLAEKMEEQNYSTGDFDRLFKEARKLAKRLCIGESRARVECLNLVPHVMSDLFSFIGRIIQVEVTLEEGEEVPDQMRLPEADEVDDMDAKQLAKAEKDATALGEGSAASGSVTTTARTDSPAAKSSTGRAKASTATKSKGSGTSPSTSAKDGSK